MEDKTVIYKPNELYHWGILGMRWGVRRFQNKDGTLTNDGKKRYGVNESKANIPDVKEPDKPDREKYKYDTFSKKVNEEIGNEDVRKKISELKASSDSFSNKADKLGEKYDSYYKQLINNKDFDSQAKKVIDNEELDYFDKYDKIRDMIDEYMPESLNKEYEMLYDQMDKYWDGIKELSDSLFSKYENTDVVSYTDFNRNEIENGKKVANELLTNSITNNHWESYLYKHFDDYWKYDRDSRYAILEKYGFD